MSPFLHRVLPPSVGAAFEANSVASFVVTGALGYLLWRLWAFNISPRLHSERPKTYPYWVPFFGHIGGFLVDSNKTITQARLHFKNSRKPFALVLGGQNVYIITSAKDTITAFKYVSQLSFDSYLKDMTTRFGMSPAVMEAAWRVHKDSSMHPGQAISAAQLLPGPHLAEFQAALLGRIHERYRFGFPRRLVREHRGTEKVLSLETLVCHTLTESMTRTLFGKALQLIQINIDETLARYDEDSWKFTYQVPPMFSRDMLRAKNVTQNSLRQYFELPESERTEACWMVKELESEMRTIGATSQDISASMMLFYWVANTNAWKAAFWMLTHILFDGKLKARVKDELAPYFPTDTNLSPSELQERLETCPLFTAVYNETLRMTAASISVRDVLEDCTIDNLTLQKGSRLIIPYRQMLLDENVFGPDAEFFVPDRFLQNPALAKDPSFRPFGGGVTFCPGRFVAQKEIMTLVAVLLMRSGVELEEGELEKGLPEMDGKKPSLGIMVPKKGRDVLVRMKERWDDSDD